MISSKRHTEMNVVRCIEFTGYRNPEGYGKYRSGKLRDKFAHRVEYEKVHGSIPDGMCVLHKCDNPPCINIEHLFLGTRTDNNRDRASKGRTFIPNGILDGNHILSEQNVLDIRSKYSTGDYTQKELGEEFGVARNTIGYIVRRKLWRHLID